VTRGARAHGGEAGVLGLAAQRADVDLLRDDGELEGARGLVPDDVVHGETGALGVARAHVPVERPICPTWHDIRICPFYVSLNVVLHVMQSALSSVHNSLMSDERRNMLNNKRTIPEIRDRLREIAVDFDIPEIHELVDEMYRKSPIRRAVNRSEKLTPALAAEIRVYARANPDMHQREIANIFNMNPGRVSEAMNDLV